MGKTTLVDQILQAILELPSYSEQQIINAVNGVVDDPELAQLIATAMINAHGYPDLSEEDVRNIIRGIVDSQTA